MIAARATCDAFAGGALTGFRAANPSVLGYVRHGERQTVLVLANFSEFDQPCPAEVFSALAPAPRDLISGRTVRLLGGLTLAPYEVLWLDIGRTFGTAR